MIMNVIYGTISREIWRFLKHPEQTIINEVYFSLLFLCALYSIESQYYGLYVIGIVFYTGFKIVFSNLKMSIFLGKLEKNIFYQLASALPRELLYLIYNITSVFRAIIFSGIFLLLLKLLFGNLAIKNMMLFSVTTFFSCFVFANFSILCILPIKTWNGMGAMEAYVYMPLLFLSGFFYPRMSGINSIIFDIMHINPLFHLYNMAVFFSTGIELYPIIISCYISGILFVVSTTACLFVFHRGYGLLE